MYNDPNTTGSGSASQATATPTQHGIPQSSGSAGKEADLRRNVMDPKTDIASRPNPSTNLSAGSGIADDASTASIRSGVVGNTGNQSSPIAPTSNIGGMDYATGLSAPHTQPERSTTPVGSPRPGTARLPTMDPLSGHQHKGKGHKFKGDPCPPGDEPLVPGYPHHFQGPHGTDTANRLDPHVPHVPGEFPSDDGFDIHEGERDGGLNQDPVSAASEAQAAQARGGALTGQTMSTDSHHHGRDAALAAGAGAAGIGAYEANKHHNQTSEPRPMGADTYDTGSSAVASPSTTDRSFPLSSHSANPESTTSGQPMSRDVTSDTPREQHLGRDAAVAGGIGAAGLGAHEAASHTHPHGSSHAPIRTEGFEDQRFDPAAASGDKPTRIPNLIYGSGTKPAHSEQTGSHNYGRDAALAGGAGAAGTQLHGYNHGGPTETDPATKTVGPHKSNILNVIDPRVLPQPEKQKDRTTTGPYRSDAMNTLDPRVDAHQAQQPQQSQHHYGRDAAVAGGIGAAGVGAYEYGQHGHQAGSTQQDPASFTKGPHQSNAANIADPRVQPEPEKMTDRSTAGPHHSAALNRADPRVSDDPSAHGQHYYGRDAALAGGAGAVGAGAYEHGKHQSGPAESSLGTSTFDPRSTNTTNVVDPNTDPTLAQQNQGHHYGRDAAIAGGAGAAGVGAYEYAKHQNNNNNPASATAGPHPTNTANVVDPRVQSNPAPVTDRSVDPTLSQKDKQHHYGRDAALAGGAGAAGVGAYEHGKHQGGPTESNLGTSTFDPRSTNTTNVVDPSTDPTLAQQQNQGHHYGRDAAMAGGAGAAGYGAYEALDPKEQEKLAKHQAKEAEKAQKAEQHQIEKDQKAQQHQLEKEQKAKQHQLDKDLKHQQKEREHEIAKQEKAAAKEREHNEKKAAAAAAAAHEKEEKKHQQQLEKEEKERQKQAEKEAEKGEKKHGIFGFLHRDKSKEPEEDLRQQGNLREADIAAHERHQRELEARAAEGDIPVAGAKFEPPLEEQKEHPMASAPQYVSIDDKGHQHVSTDVAGRHRLHKDPPASVLKERGLDGDSASR